MNFMDSFSGVFLCYTLRSFIFHLHLITNH